MRKIIVVICGILFLASCGRSKNELTKYPHSSKSLCCFGDSFTEMNLYQSYLASSLGISTWTSDGVSGSCITSGTNYAEGDKVNRVPLIDRCAKLKSDIIVVVASTNDWYYHVPLGEESNRDTKTFYGAYKSMLSTLITNNPSSIVVTVTMLQRGYDRSAFESQKQYADAVKYCSQLYAVPCIDMFSISGFTYENNKTLTTDGAHPTPSVGGKLFGERIARFINLL